MKPDLDDYYDLLILLGRVSLLVETFYSNLNESQMSKINIYCDTVLFHINERSDRQVILYELESMLRFVDVELKKLKL